MAGRGAWSASGVGGTRQYKDATRPGPYYYTGTGYVTGARDANQYAVWTAVKVFQQALTDAGFRCLVDGLYGPATTRAMTAYQQAWAVTGDPVANAWGGVGPQTSERLLRPTLTKVYAATPHNPKVTEKVVAGVIRTESSWDPGAVGYADETDVGLAQINASAHPTWSTDMRLKPETSFAFVIEYLTSSLVQLGDNLRDAIASYNLGVGGTRRWIAAGRPQWWAPPGTDQSKPRNVKLYIDRILQG